MAAEVGAVVATLETSRRTAEAVAELAMTATQRESERAKDYTAREQATIELGWVSKTAMRDRTLSLGNCLRSVPAAALLQLHRRFDLNRRSDLWELLRTDGGSVGGPMGQVGERTGGQVGGLHDLINLFPEYST